MSYNTAVPRYIVRVIPDFAPTKYDPLQSCV